MLIVQATGIQKDPSEVKEEYLHFSLFMMRRKEEENSPIPFIFDEI
jgi:hypothetical protein